MSRRNDCFAVGNAVANVCAASFVPIMPMPKAAAGPYVSSFRYFASGATAAAHFLRPRAMAVAARSRGTVSNERIIACSAAASGIRCKA